MDEKDSGRKLRRDPHSGRRSWCCYFTVPPGSPETLSFSQYSKTTPRHLKSETLVTKSVSNSPSVKSRIDPRRILSPERVSPIDSDPPVVDFETEAVTSPLIVETQAKVETGGVFDVRLNLKGKHGGCLVLELNSEVLSANSVVFAKLVADFKSGSNGSGAKFCRIEVPEVENLRVFKETIELMFEDDVMKKLFKVGAYQCIDMLEVSAGIMFARGVLHCLQYLEAVPWSEVEEEKLRSLFARFKFDDATSQDILARLYPVDSDDSQNNMARELVWSITTCTDAVSRTALKSLVKGLLCRSSVYKKDKPDITKEDMYVVSESCLQTLISLFEEASETTSCNRSPKKENNKTLIERIGMQVDNINWLLEIMLDWQVGEEFVDIWGNQKDLLSIHATASPMLRYELSRISATLFNALGTRKLHCCFETRLCFLQSWFGPMLLDFGWLQRCRKGLDIKALEEGIGQSLLTLPLRQQHILFMEWSCYFSKYGKECPNLSKAFQIWWRRSFLRGSESSTMSR
uniref:At3g05675-like ankyrin-like domain-containing protein n=1 Tax=Kalanchoe fedtschenkoi TaxID=63787 RepID=A0A7N0TNR8_KALFE